MFMKNFLKISISYFIRLACKHIINNPSAAERFFTQLDKTTVPSKGVFFVWHDKVNRGWAGIYLMPALNLFNSYGSGLETLLSWSSQPALQLLSE